MTTAVTEAVRERLDRVHREHGVDLAERLLLIGRDCAAHLKEPFRTMIMRACSKGRGLDFLWSVVPWLSAK